MAGAPPALAVSGEPNRERSHAARLSIAVSASLLLVKLGVAVWTGSLALMASALDSLLDLFASTVNIIAIRTAEAPPDAEHPYGHGKAEYLGGLVQAAVIGLSGGYVFVEALERLFNPVPVSHTEAGIGLMLVSMLASGWVVVRLRRTAQATDSPALWADSVHYLTDVYTNGGTLVALVIVLLTGQPLLDTVAGIGIAALVLWSAVQVLTQSVNGLMDHGLAEDEIERIRRIILKHPDVYGIHELRARRSGADKFVQVHVEMDGGMSFEDAHSLAETLTTEIETSLRRASVTVHADPVHVNAAGEVIARAATESPPLPGVRARRDW